MGGAVALWTVGDEVEVVLRKTDDLEVVNLMGEVLGLRENDEGVTIRLRAGDAVFAVGEVEAVGEGAVIGDGGGPDIIRF